MTLPIVKVYDHRLVCFVVITWPVPLSVSTGSRYDVDFECRKLSSAKT